MPRTEVNPGSASAPFVSVSPGAAGMAYTDRLALNKWGNYLTRVEKAFVLKGIGLAGNRSTGVDLGCGSGRWSKLASDAGWRMTCIDVDQSALAICQRNLPEAQCILANPGATTISCPSDSVGLMFCIEVGPVMEADWFPSEAGRVLSQGGILVGVIWNRRSWRGLAWRLKSRLTKSPHVHVYYNHSYLGWRKKLMSAGFEILAQEGLCWGPVGRSSDSWLVPFYIKLEAILRLNHLIALSPWIAFIARKCKMGNP